MRLSEDRSIGSWSVSRLNKAKGDMLSAYCAVYHAMSGSEANMRTGTARWSIPARNSSIALLCLLAAQPPQIKRVSMQPERENDGLIYQKSVSLADQVAGLTQPKSTLEAVSKVLAS
jgi:hypothetical protein